MFKIDKYLRKKLFYAGMEISKCSFLEYETEFALIYTRVPQFWEGTSRHIKLKSYKMKYDPRRYYFEPGGLNYHFIA